MSKKKQRRAWKKWALGVSAVFLVLILAGCTAVLSVSNNLMDKAKVKDQSESSVIYDKDGKEITKLYSNINREYIDFAHIPDQLKKAIVDTEDTRFYQHSGVDVIGIARAVYKDIRAGGAVEGASTITQQLAKNVYLSNTKSIWRKTQEALIALNLERNYSKDQILEFYLNEIYFGNGNYGVQAASKYYFGKDVSKLDLAEIATLAGMPKAPNTYAPIPNYDKSVERRKTVLSLMVKNGTITQKQADDAGKEQLNLATIDKKKDQWVQTYIDYALQEAEDKYGLKEDQIYRGGYEIYTALDTQAQRAMADAFANPKLFPANSKTDMVQGAMVILDPHDGGIVAMQGGRDYVAKGLNRATSKNRTPGSSFKPLVVYGPALEEGRKPFDLLKDEKMTFPGGYSPSNWNGDGYLGQVTMYEAIKRSKNVPAVWLLNEMGIDTGFRYLDRFGIPYDKKNDRKLGIALGDIGVSPLDMAKGYSAFANKGIIYEPHVISKITDDGKTITADVNNTTAISEKTANTMTSMLMGVVNEGTGKQAQMNRPVAGKTGTTQMPGTSGNRDAWFVGYTPEYVGAVWMGFDRSDSSSNYLRQGSEVPAKFFSVVMTEALKGRPVKSFPNLEDLEPVEPQTPQVTTVQDLKAEQLAESIHLTWSVPTDTKSTYHLYRYTDDPNKKQQIGETEKGEWIDIVPKLDQPVHYYVVSYDPTTKQEGPMSNVVEVRSKGLQAPDLKSPTPGNNQQQNPNTGKKDGKVNSPEAQTRDGNTDKSVQPPNSNSKPGKAEKPSPTKQDSTPTDGSLRPPELGNNGG